MTTKAKRRQLSPEFKVEALKLATKTSVASAAKDPGINESQLYNWRSAASKKLSTSARESELATEVAKLKRQLAEQAEELEIIKRRPPTSQRTKNRVVLLHARAHMPVLCYPMACALSVSLGGYTHGLGHLGTPAYGLWPASIGMKRLRRPLIRAKSAMAPDAYRLGLKPMVISMISKPLHVA